MDGPQTSLNRTVSTAGWLLMDYGVRLGVGLVVGAVVTRYLGPAHSGILNFAIAVVACAVPLVNLDAAVVHKLVGQPEQRSVILGTATILRCLLSLTCYAMVVSCVCLFLAPAAADTQIIVAVAALPLILQIGDIVDYDLQSRLEGFKIARARLLAFAVTAAARVGLVALAASLTWFALMLPLEALMMTLLLAGTSRSHLASTLPWRFDRTLAAELVGRSWPIALSGLLFATSAHADKFVLAQMRGADELGIYFAAYQLSGLWYFVAAVVGTAAAPSLTRNLLEAPAQYFLSLRQLSCALTALAIGIATVTSLLADQIVDVLYGAAFHESALLLRIHIWTCVFVFHVHLRTRILAIENCQHYIAIFAAVTLVAGMGLNVLLVGIYGGVGAAYASVLTWSIAVLVGLVPASTRRHAFLFLSSLNPLSWRRLLLQPAGNLR